MKRLYRSRTDRVLAGICSGIGVYFDVDPIIIRIVWVVLTLASLGIGIITYIIAWALIPEEPSPLPVS